MVEINVYSDIANKKEGVWMSMWGLDDSVFSADTVKTLFNDHKSEKDFKFNIHCDGGSVTEGLAIYDIIRNSGKNIYTNIEGGCHSMAICLLLAAPFENRTANRNARALIHEVRGFGMDYMTADEMRDYAEEIEREQNAILDIYEDRTTTDRATLEKLMKDEKQHTAKELLDYGFISQINNYTTNKNFKNMSKPNKNVLLNKATQLLNSIKNLLDGAVNYDHTDEDGNILFSTEVEDDALEVGMAASPDGVFTLPNGVTVTISEGEITDIDNDDNEELENLKNENEELRNKLQEANDVVSEMKNLIESNYNVKPRNSTPGSKKPTGGRSTEDLKNEAREKRNKFKGRGGK